MRKHGCLLMSKSGSLWRALITGALIRLPSPDAHAAVHAVVETQISMGDETPVRCTASRLMAEGLDRHEAIHAIGIAFMGTIHDIANAARADADPNERY